MVHGAYKHSDPKNELKRRNIRNVPRNLFNCAGYALGTFSWVHVTNSIFDLDPEGCVDNMLREFDNVRVIRESSELKTGEYLVAFRTGPRDFHFMKRGKNGVWYHKMGSTAPIHRATKQDVFADKWTNRVTYYDSEITLLAVRE